MKTEKQVFEGTFYNKELWNNLPEIHNRCPQPIKFIISSVIFLNSDQFVKIQPSITLNLSYTEPPYVFELLISTKRK